MPDKLCLKGSRNPLEMARSLAYKMRFRMEAEKAGKPPMKIPRRLIEQAL